MEPKMIIQKFKHITALLVLPVIFTSCIMIPEMFQSMEEIITDEAVEITISKEAFQSDTQLDILITIKNNPK
jgi:hypothetical protein